MVLKADSTEREPLEPSVADAFRADDSSLDDLPIAVLVFLDGQVVRVNDGWTAMTGLDIDQSRGSRWLSAVHPDHRVQAEAVPRLAFGGTDAAGDWRLVRVLPDGQIDDEVWVHARVRHAKTVNVRTCVVTLTEIAAHKATELRLLHLAMHDPLTGLPNRDAFVGSVDAALERAARDHVTSVLFVDLDRFKQVNDRYGHLCGDKLLVAVAQRLRATLRPFDRLGRLGGDELGIVCEMASAEDATRLADRVVETLSEPFAIDNEILTIGASIGVAFAAPGTTTSQELIAEADRAMYRAKDAGGGQWWMHGAREVDLRSRWAVAEANAALAQLAADLAQLHARAAALQAETGHLHDPRLAQRLDAIVDALHGARSLAEHHDSR